MQVSGNLYCQFDNAEKAAYGSKNPIYAVSISFIIHNVYIYIYIIHIQEDIHLNFHLLLFFIL